jgi:glycosyltransferase involved in cell wall biosynthesis
MKSVSPFFSIIIPVYNVARYLHECLDSAINQSYPGFEIICVNDGSTDGSGDILYEYNKEYEFIKIISQENKGLSAARNAGIKAAKGDYIFFLDSDDWIEQDTLKILAEQQNGEDLLCFNGRRYFEDGTKEEPDKGITESNLTGWDYYNKYALAPRKFHFVCTVLRIYKRSFLIEYNLNFKEGIYHEDNLFTPVVCYYARVVKVIPDCLYVYRIRHESITQSISYSNVEDMVIGTNILTDFFVPKVDIDKTKIYRETAGKYIRVFYSDITILCGNRHKQIRLLINWKNFKVVAKYPRQKRIYNLIKIHPVLVRIYIKLEDVLKKSY